MTPSDRTGPALALGDLSKTYGYFKALQDVTFQVATGDCLLLLGANGAGKTTLLKLVAGLSRPSGGFIRLLGTDARRLPPAARAEIGFLSHTPQLYGELDARENLRFFGRLYGIADGEARIEEMLLLVELQNRASEMVRHYSRGMQQRLSIAKAFLHRPRLLLLDEPHTGLDPHAARVLNRLFAQFHGDGGTLIIATHNLEFPPEFANRLAILRQGRLALFEAISGITGRELGELFEKHR